MRIISLIASATEIVCALGFEDQLVGRSHECDFPATVLKLPACSEPKINIHTTSAEIDRQVKEVVRDSLSVYRVDVEQLKCLNPDVIITQDHCEVCAVSLKDVEAAVCNWLDSRPQIVSLRPDALKDIWLGIEQVAAALGNCDKGKQLVQDLKDQMQAIVKQIPQNHTKPTVACIEWIDPLMAAGNWIPELVAMAGAIDVFGVAGKHSPWMTFAELQKKDPDYIITMPCGWDIERTREEMYLLTEQKGWSELKAVKSNRVFITDGNQFFNRPGPRVVESLQILTEILYSRNTSSLQFKMKAWQTI
ncbi:MAG: cobalamin-binding protein [Candidatus Omnitrophica bacterium]|nr:cobalamin-binding protein [Candidatus Omnitrophota bacterium]